MGAILRSLFIERLRSLVLGGKRLGVSELGRRLDLRPCREDLVHVVWLVQGETVVDVGQPAALRELIVGAAGPIGLEAGIRGDRVGVVRQAVVYELEAPLNFGHLRLPPGNHPLVEVHQRREVDGPRLPPEAHAALRELVGVDLPGLVRVQEQEEAPGLRPVDVDRLEVLHHVPLVPGLLEVVPVDGAVFALLRQVEKRAHSFFHLQFLVVLGRLERVVHEHARHHVHQREHGEGDVPGEEDGHPGVREGALLQRQHQLVPVDPAGHGLVQRADRARDVAKEPAQPGDVVHDRRLLLPPVHDQLAEPDADGIHHEEEQHERPA
mmetsp:Transcript_12755/g.36084  ORF Transcript_12755/g.36084 Transcript_12755/m.36084 type:complete len:323 (-) Transcript_12755:17-985(-)